MTSRYVTPPEPARSAPENPRSDGRGDPDQRYRVYKLCECDACAGRGKIPEPQPAYLGTPTGSDGEDVSAFSLIRCPECRGEGRTLQLVATCPGPQALGTALVTLATEGEFDECPVGILEDGGSWLLKPWGPSPRNTSDAGRVLQAAKKGEKNDA